MFANEDQLIHLYGYDEKTKELTGGFEYMWSKGFGFAANSTNITPPAFNTGFIPVFNSDDQEWIVVEDHRGKIVYSTSDKSQQTIDYIGPIAAGFTELKPGHFDTWHGSEWVDNRTPEQIAEYERSLLPALPKRQFALYLYDHDLYDLVMTALDKNLRFKIEYDNAKELERLSPTVSAMAALLGWTDEQVDRMWAEALTL